MAVGGLGLLGPAGPTQGVAQHLAAVAVPRPQVRRTPQAGDRLVVLPLSRQSITQVREPLDIFLAVLDRLSVAVDRLIQPPELLQCHALVAVRLGEVVLQLDRPLRRPQRLDRQVHPPQHRRMVVVILGILRRKLDRLADQLQRLLHLPPRHRRQPQEMDRLRRLRLLLEHLPVRRLGFGNLARAEPGFGEL